MASLASRNSEADWAQLAPSATAVTTWRSALVRTSPAARHAGHRAFSPDWRRPRYSLRLVALSSAPSRNSVLGLGAHGHEQAVHGGKLSLVVEHLHVAQLESRQRARSSAAMNSRGNGCSSTNSTFAELASGASW